MLTCPGTGKSLSERIQPVVEPEWSDTTPADHEKLSCRDEDGVPRDLVVGDALSDSGYKLRREALHHLPDAGSKFVEDVNPRVAANRRTKIVEWRRSGPRPIWTVSSVDSNRSQHPVEVRNVQPPLPGVVTCDKNTRSCVGGPAHKGVASRSVITWVERRRSKVFAKQTAGLLLNKRHLIISG